MMKKKIFKSILSVMMVALIAVTVLAGCSAGDGKVPSEFPFEVTDQNGEVSEFTVKSDGEQTVGAALQKAGMIQGDETDFGLYVTTVNGITVDFEADGVYWEFRIDGEFAMTGADATDIEAGKVYAFVYTKG